MKKLLVMFLTVVMVVSMVAGCGDKDTSSEGSGTEENSDSDEGATKDSLIVGIGTDFQNLVPVCNNVAVANTDGPAIFALYDSLLWRDSTTGEITSCICTDYAISEDGLEYTLTLRDDVYFHNGEKMTAEDVAWTLNLLPGTTVQKNNYPTFDRAEVVDENTVKIILTAPFAPMLNALAAYHVVILCKSYFDEVGVEGYMEHPIGTGPYAFVERVTGSSMELVANDKYWGGEPSIKNVKFSIIPDVNTQIISLESGDVDILMKVSITEALRLDESKGLKWDSTVSDSTSCIIFNGGNDLCNDENFRKAVLSGINYDGINQAINSGYTTKANAIVRPGISGRPEDGEFADALPYDVEAAKEYLSKSNYTEGTPVSIIVRSGSTDESIAKVVQGDLQSLGINIQINAVDAATFSSSTTKGEFDIQIYTMMPSLFDINLLYQQFNIDNAVMQLSKFEDKQQLNDLGREALSELDTEKRVSLYAEMMDIVNTKAYMGFIYYDVNVVAWRADLQNVNVISGTNYRISDWYWK